MDNIFEYLNINSLENLRKFKEKYVAMDDDKIFHYTNLDSLKNMLESNSLWATNCEYLNDLSELETFEKELDQILNNGNESMILYIKNILNELSKMKKLTYFLYQHYLTIFSHINKYRYKHPDSKPYQRYQRQKPLSMLPLPTNQRGQGGRPIKHGGKPYS